MHEKAKLAVLRQLQNLAQQAVSAFSPSTPGTQHLIRLETSEGPLLLRNEAADEYDTVIDNLLRKNATWRDRFSSGYLSKRLGEILAVQRQPDGHKQSAEAFDLLISELDTFDTEVVVYVPLYGFDMSGMTDDELQMGPLRLLKMSPERVQHLVGQITSAANGANRPYFHDLIERGDYLAQVSANTSEQQAIEIAIEDIKKLEYQVCFEYRKIAEPDKAWESAEELARQALDLLMYALPALFPPNMVHVGLMGEEWDGSQRYPIVALDGSIAKFKFKRTAGLYPFVITPGTVERLKNLGVFKVAEILERADGKRTDFERTLLRAIHWFADALRQRDKENSFLSLMICLECFYTPKDAQQPIMATVAESAALVLGSNLEERKRLKKDVQTLYGIRSAITHGRRIMSASDHLYALQSIASRTIAHLTARAMEFTGTDGLLAWLEEMKFS